MKRYKIFIVGILLIGVNLFAYSSQNTINDPFQQLNRNIQYNNMNQQNMDRINSNRGSLITQIPYTYEQPQYQQTPYVSNGGGSGSLESLGISLGILALMFLLL